MESNERPSFLVGDVDAEQAAKDAANVLQETSEATDKFNQNISENGSKTGFDLAEKRRRLR